MSAWWVEFAAAFAVVASAAGLLGLVVPLRNDSFQRHLATRVVRQLGRFAIVLIVVVVGVRGLGGAPASVAAGALGGWLVSAGWEAVRSRRQRQESRTGATGR